MRLGMSHSKHGKESMILGPVFAVLFVIFSWREFFSWQNSFFEHFLQFVSFVVLTTTAFFMGIGLSVLIGFFVPKHLVGPETVKLVSLRDGDSIGGKFFLGTGTIDNDQYYFFYKEAGSGYQPGKVKLENNITLFEEKNRVGGELRVYKYKFVDHRFDRFAVILLDDKYELFVPEGSIKKDFVLQ